MPQDFIERSFGDDGFDQAMDELDGKQPPESQTTPEENTQTPPAASEPPAEPAKTTAVEEAPPAETIPQYVAEAFPEAKTPDDISKAIKTLREDLDGERSANDEMVKILEADPAIIEVLKDVRDGVPFYQAVAKHLKEEKIPSPEEDAEGYREYVKRQVEREIREKKGKEESDRSNLRMDGMRKQAAEMRKSFQERTKLTEPDMTAFIDWVKAVTYGDPATGKLPPNYLELMYLAYNHDKDVEAAKKSGQVGGRNEAINALKNKSGKVGDGVPHLSSGATPVQVKTPTDKEFEELSAAFETKSKIFST